MDEREQAIREAVEAFRPLVDNAGGYDKSNVRALVLHAHRAGSITDEKREDLCRAEERARAAMQALAALSPVQTESREREALQTLAAFARTAPGRLPSRVEEALNVAAALASSPVGEPRDDEDDEGVRCTCEWQSPNTGAVRADWPDVLDPECRVHGAPGGWPEPLHLLSGEPRTEGESEAHTWRASDEGPPFYGVAFCQACGAMQDDTTRGQACPGPARFLPHTPGGPA